MTITTTPDVRVAPRLAELREQRAAIPDDGTLPIATTQDELDSLRHQREVLDGRIYALELAAAAYAALPSLADDTAWLAFLTVSRKALVGELFTFKSPLRDRALKARAEDISFCIRLIDFGFAKVARLGILTLAPTRLGFLMQQAGYHVEGEALRGPHGWRGSIPETEERIKVMTAKRVAAQKALNAALMTDAERAANDAHRTTLGGLRVRRSPDGRGYVVVDAEGEIRDIATLSASERAAFEYLEATER